ncbi:hypothetical protein M8494_07055 [Serratia ureilytica]
MSAALPLVWFAVPYILSSAALPGAPLVIPWEAAASPQVTPRRASATAVTC